MKNIPEIHISDIRQFTKCRRLWRFTSPLKMNYESRTPNPHFLVGTLFHELFELVLKGSMPEDIFESVKAHVLRNVPKNYAAYAQVMIAANEMRKTIKNYYAYWAKQPNHRWSDDKFKFVAIENAWNLPIPDVRNPGKVRKDARFGGRQDGLVRRLDDNTYWVWENKTSARPDQLLESLFNDEQSGLYYWAAQQLYHVPIQGIVYNIVNKNQPLSAQEVVDKHTLASGKGLSKAKSINTLHTIYVDAVRLFHKGITDAEIAEQYGDIIKYLAVAPNNYFIREEIYRSPEEIKQLIINLSAKVDEMINPRTYLYSVPSQVNCNGCALREPCEAITKGEDWESILKFKFKNKDRYEETKL